MYCRTTSRLNTARIGVLAVALAVSCVPAQAQDDRRIFAGGVFGISTLSADGRSATAAPDISVSLYKPENGPALNVFAGLHLAEYFSVQANWMWNRNDVALVSSFASPQRGGFFEQHRRSHQHVLDVDGLIYFRRLDSAVRPYLGTGLAVIRFTSDAIISSASSGLEPPAVAIASTRIGLRSHVGIDVSLSDRLSFRYSFSETISGNPISSSLTPPGERRLANFQNLFGLLGRF